MLGELGLRLVDADDADDIVEAQLPKPEDDVGGIAPVA